MRVIDVKQSAARDMAYLSCAPTTNQRQHIWRSTRIDSFYDTFYDMQWIIHEEIRKAFSGGDM